MARALLLALTCAAAASAARYADYSGVKMPAYGGASDYESPRDAAAAQASDDYHGHSPDAPASLDYKYEEEPRIQTEKPTKDSDDQDVWRKPGRKQRGLMRPIESASGELGNKYERDEEDVPKPRSSRRYPKHRSRLKGDAPPIDEESPPRRAIKYSRDRKDDVSDIDRKDNFHVDKDDFPDDKSKEFDEDIKLVNEGTNRRVMRRKPRDRYVKRKSSDLNPFEEELEPDRRIKMDSDKEGPRRTRPVDMRAPLESRARDRFRPVFDEEEDEELNKVQPLKKLKAADDYDDYYDMKRVYSIKNKLPSLLRRTSERDFAPTTTHFLDAQWTNRRKMPDAEEAAVEHSSTSVASATTSLSTTTTTTTTTTPTTTTTTVSTTTVNNTALSLAEKSRLSILKKSQRKEGQHVNPPTKKPPVLLQVTNHLPTVVMVEPPSSMKPWMRVHEVADDSPERLEKVKKMMRHKLVADARSIHDLTENWDDMVCDYIDMALLENVAAPVRAPAAPCRLLADILCVHILFYFTNIYL